MVYEYDCGHWRYLLFPNLLQHHTLLYGHLIEVEDVTLEYVAQQLEGPLWVRR
jgi:hypothetical protein